MQFFVTDFPDRLTLVIQSLVRQRDSIERVALATIALKKTSVGIFERERERIAEGGEKRFLLRNTYVSRVFFA